MRSALGPPWRQLAARTPVRRTPSALEGGCSWLRQRQDSKKRNGWPEDEGSIVRDLSGSDSAAPFGGQAIISSRTLIKRWSLNQSSQQLDRPTVCFRSAGQAIRARLCVLARPSNSTPSPPQRSPSLIGSLVASHGFGRFTYETESPVVQADTIFDLASVTKVVATTAMAMLLYERGQLRSTCPSGNFLPDFVSRAPRHQQARARRSPFECCWRTPADCLPTRSCSNLPATRDALVRAALDDSSGCAHPARTPITATSDLSCSARSWREAGLSLDVFARQEIFTPLGMTHTRFNPPAEWKPAIPPTEDDRAFRKRIIQGEVNDENASVMGGVAGHAGVFAPAIDVARFAECMLRRGAPAL